MFATVDTAPLEWVSEDEVRTYVPLQTVLKPSLNDLDYTVVCFMTQRLQPETVKAVAVQAKCGLKCITVGTV